MFASIQRDLKPFARQLAEELSVRLRPGSGSDVPRKETSRDSTVARALEHIRAKGTEFRGKHKIGLFKRLFITRTFQRELNDRGFEGPFIRDATLTLIRALTPEKR